RTTAQIVRASPCTDIDIDPGGKYWVYPMMAFLNADGSTPRIWFAGVANGSVSNDDPGRRPACAVICLYCATLPDKWNAYQREGWDAIAVGDNILFQNKRLAAALQ